MVPPTAALLPANRVVIFQVGWDRRVSIEGYADQGMPTGRARFEHWVVFENETRARRRRVLPGAFQVDSDAIIEGLQALYEDMGVQDVPDTFLSDPELAAGTARVTALEAAKLEAERRLAALPPATSRGEATRRAIAQRLLAARRADLERTLREQEALRQRVDASRQDRGATVATRLKEATEAEADYQTRVTALAEEVAQRATGRAERIRTAVERDAAYVPPERGILARMRVLAKLTDDGWNFTLLLLLHAFFLGIELAAVLSKVLSAVPSSYAVRLAGDEYATEYETVDGVHRRIAALGGAAPPAATSDRADDGPEPPAPATAAANDDVSSGDEVPFEDDASDTEDRLRDGARAARAQAAARARTKDKAREKTAETADGADAAAANDDLTAGPVRRGPGRPPGARNKPKPDNDDHPPSEDGQDVA